MNWLFGQALWAIQNSPPEKAVSLWIALLIFSIGLSNQMICEQLKNQKEKHGNND